MFKAVLIWAKIGGLVFNLQVMPFSTLQECTSYLEYQTKVIEEDAIFMRMQDAYCVKINSQDVKEITNESSTD